jgi:hypothetical protein
VRCKLVCRDWRDTLDDVSAWTRLDLSRSSGVTCTVNDAALRGASGLARGALAALDVSGTAKITQRALIAVAEANSGALTTLTVHDGVLGRAGCQLFACVSDDVISALLLAAPRLRALHADVTVSPSVAARVLRNEAPLFAPVRARHLHCTRLHGCEPGVVIALAADVAAHAPLASLCLSNAPLDAPAALDAVIDAVQAARLHAVYLDGCGLSPASAPALARFLGASGAGGALTTLALSDGGRAPLLDAHAAALLGDALRANNTLTTLSLSGVGLWSSGVGNGVTLLSSLVAHASLRALELRFEAVPQGSEAEDDAVGAALGALLAANAAPFESLTLDACWLRDACLAPLFEALRTNSHLRALDCSLSSMSAPFVAQAVLPAVRENVSLRSLTLNSAPGPAAMAVAVVTRRVAALAAAADALTVAGEMAC